MPSQDAVLRQIESYLRSSLSDPDDDFVYIVPIPAFAPHDDRLVQIVPGAPRAIHPRSGGGSVSEEFSVAYWRRLFTDYAISSSDLIASGTRGVLAGISDVRQAFRSADNADLNTLLVLPQFIAGSRPMMSRDHPGWAYVEDTYRIEYDLGWRH